MNKSMEFLKDVLGDLYTEVEKRVKEAGIKLADLSKGEYVSKDKFLNREKELKSQIEALNTQVTNRDSDIANLNETIGKIKNDAEGLLEVKNELTRIKAEREDEQRKFLEQMEHQKRKFAIHDAASAVKFSSNSAKRAFIAEAEAKGLQLDKDTGKIIGFADYLESYKQSDPDAFVVEDANTKKSAPVIVDGGSNKFGDEEAEFIPPTIL